MTDDATPKHVLLDALTDYFDGRLDQGAASRVEIHLADCTDCTALAREIWSARVLLARWSPAVHGAAYWSDLLESALAKLEAEPQFGSWRGRLRRWRDRWACRVDGAALVVMEAGGRFSRIVTEGLEELMRPGATWSFAPVPTPQPTRGGAGEADGATGAVPPVTTVLASGATPARMMVSDTTREIVVRIDGLDPGSPPPLVVLFPAESLGRPILVEPHRVQGADYWIARFEDPSPGVYLVALEPLAT